MDSDCGCIALIVFALLAVVSVPQLVWTRRVVERVRTWLANSRYGIELVPFASFSRWAQWGWLIVIVLALVAAVEAQFDFGASSQQAQTVFLCAAVALWSLIQCIISVKSQTLCQQVSRFAAMRQLDAQDLAAAAQLLPQGVGPPVSEETLQRRLNTLGRVTLVWLIVLVVHIVVAALVLIALGLDNIASSAGQLLLMFVLTLLPGLVALYVVRCVVEARARRAQFLWFLAATTKSQRPLASELMGWGRSHPGRYGSRVMEVARDIGVGESLADALETQRGLLNPSDLMSVRVAEQTGTLAATLRDCAVRQTQALKGDSVVRNASGTAVWLWAVIVVAITITSFLMYYIVPKFKAIFMGFGTELPGVTVLLISLSDMFVRYGALFSPVFTVLSMVLLWSCGEAFLRGWSETWLAWRLGYGRQSEIPRLLRRLRGAVVAKLPWSSALQPMVLKHSQSDIRSRLERVLGRVTAGMGVWPAMRDSGLLNARDVSLLEMAERANNLEWALSALAESKERSLVHRWQVLMTLSVPVFTVAAGLMVMLICIGFFMPLVKLLNDLS
ncbi:MAG: type II secretion system F family protein [Planctomycetaceae bacterium]|nr:type II secretion system F family protein [Planctomycetaceae bacterium]